MKPHFGKGIAATIFFAVVIGNCLPAFAGTLSFLDNYGPLAAGAPDFPLDLSFPRFDPSLGTLTGIDIIFTATMDLQASVANVGPATSFTDAVATGTATATGPDGTSTSIILSTTPFSGSIGAGTFLPTIVNGPAETLTDAKTAQVPAADFGLYELGGGSTGNTINLDTTVSFNGNGAPGSVFFGGTGTDNGSVEIEYVFSTPDSGSLIPELTLCCMCGFTAFRRIRRPIGCV
jgi:hypothetical protein